jgi:hypothetical protein
LDAAGAVVESVADGAVGFGVSEFVDADVRQRVTDAEARLTRHLAAIEAGVDPQALVTAMNAAQADKAAARAELKNLPKLDRLTETEIRKLIESLGDIRAVLAAGNPSDKVQLYRALDLQVRYQHQQQLAIVGATPVGLLVSGGG